jgi:hypothetical protein
MGTPTPVRFDRSARPRAGALYIERAAIACAAKALSPQTVRSPESYARTRWGDGETERILRGASAPAQTTVTGWAKEFSHDVVGEFIASLAPMSASARLFNVAPRVSLAGVNTVRFPARSGAISASYVQWIAENAPAPVLRFSTASGAVLGPARKLLCFAVITRELADSSSAEIVITTLLRENAALQLDTSLFSNVAASSARPAGILNGVTPLTAATGGGDAALDSDLTALAAAISPVTAGLAFVCNPAQGNAIKLRKGTTFPTDVPVWSTIAVPAGTVIALDPAAFVSAFDGDPEISSSIESSLHFEDTSPQEIVSSPGTVAAPQKSIFQTEMLATRLRIKAAWAWRVSGAVSFVQNTTW